eukprot:gene5025-5517_t
MIPRKILLAILIALFCWKSLGVSNNSGKKPKSKPKPVDRVSPPQPASTCSLSSKGDGKMVLEGYDMEIYWKSPYRVNGCPRGIVVALLPCGYNGLEWWGQPTSRTAGEGQNKNKLDSAVGSKSNDELTKLASSWALPVESRIARHLLQAGYTVLSLAPYTNRKKNKCWHEQDLPYISHAVQRIVSQYSIVTHHHPTIGPSASTTASSISKLPVFALGVFKAGFFLGMHASTLSQKHNLTLTGVIIMNSGIWHSDYSSHPFPPVCFIDMNRNSQVAYHNEKVVADMGKHGLPSVHYSSWPWPLNEEYFANQGVLDRNASRVLYQTLLADGRYLWPGSGILMVDPTSNLYAKGFKQMVKSLLPTYVEKDVLNEMHSPLLQVIRMAYGHRETSDEFIREMTQWLSSLSK